METMRMPGRSFILLVVALLSHGCGGGEKHLPSSNPPEYDPKKVYSTPAPLPLAQSAMPSDKPASAGKAVPDPCEKPSRTPPKPGEPPIACSGVSGPEEQPIIGAGGTGGGSGGGSGGGGGRSERPADPSAKKPSYVLEFQSRIVSSLIEEWVESVAAGSVVLTPVEGKAGWYRGSGMLSYQTGPPPNRDPCTTLVMGHGTTRFDVDGMFIKLAQGTDSPAHQTGSADIELHYLIHPTNETERPVSYHLEGNCSPGRALPYPFFYAKYAVARGGDEVNLLKGWTYVGRNGVVATKMLRGNCGDSCEDQTVLTLKEVDERTSPSR